MCARSFTNDRLGVQEATPVTTGRRRQPLSLYYVLIQASPFGRRRNKRRHRASATCRGDANGRIRAGGGVTGGSSERYYGREGFVVALVEFFPIPTKLMVESRRRRVASRVKATGGWSERTGVSSLMRGGSICDSLVLFLQNRLEPSVTGCVLCAMWSSFVFFASSREQRARNNKCSVIDDEKQAFHHTWAKNLLLLQLW